MDKITSFDRHIVRLLREKLQAAVKEVGAEHDINIVVGNARFDASNVTFKVEMSIIGDDGTVETKEANHFKHYAVLLGLRPDDLGSTFLFRGQSYEITGVKMSSRKYPILAKNSNGKVFKFTTADVLRGLDRLPAPVDQSPEEGFATS